MHTLDDLLRFMEPATDGPADASGDDGENGGYPYRLEVAEDAVEALVGDGCARLEKYLLSERSREIVKQFLSFHALVRSHWHELPEGRSLYGNLILRADDRSMADDFVTELSGFFENWGCGIYRMSEEALLSSANLASRNGRNFGGLQFERFSGMGKEKLVYIYDCGEAPTVSPDLSSSSAMEKAQQQAALYQAAWGSVVDYAKKHPGVVFVIQAPTELFRSTLRSNTELFYRVFGWHVYLAGDSQARVLEMVVSRLMASSFSVRKPFTDKLAEYLQSVYPRAELRGSEFADDLVRRIYTLYFSRRRSSRILTLDCIPLYVSETTSPEEILAEMDELIGLAAVKNEFRRMYQLMLSPAASGAGKPRYHMVFSGNPGTGKTTVAKMTAKLFYRMGILKTPRLVVASAADMVSIWKNGTMKKTQDLIRSAYDGVLFLDEAYALAESESGGDALNILIQEIEENADRLVVILAGYPGEMEKLMRTNPGLKSRIGRELVFQDYSTEELKLIFRQQCAREGFRVEREAEHLLEDWIAARRSREFFGNAREMGKLFQQLKEAWAQEYYEAGGDNASVSERIFRSSHFEKLMPPKNESAIQDLIGLAPIKTQLDRFRRQMLYQQRLREALLKPFTDFSMHMIFTGNPGTGKTTVAKLIANDLYSIGVLKSNRLTVAERKDLVSGAVGQTATRTAEVVRRAVGGVLFIDEAYSLAAGGASDFGREAIETLLTAMEEHKEDTVFIFAGYPREMDAFLGMNPGISSRIGYTFHFPDYSPQELVDMFLSKMTKAGFAVSAEALEAVADRMEYFSSLPNFGNGRFVNRLIQETVSRRAMRDFSGEFRDITGADVPSVRDLIETSPESAGLYDPRQLTEEDRRRTAIHELGHATAAEAMGLGEKLEKISIKSQAGSLGRVTLGSRAANATEEELFRQIVVLLSGKNAEKLFFGSHSTGCSSDYAWAKATAADMAEKYAMDGYGDTPEQILEAANRYSMELLSKYRSAMETASVRLMSEKELTGSELSEIVRRNPAKA